MWKPFLFIYHYLVACLSHIFHLYVYFRLHLQAVLFMLSKGEVYSRRFVPPSGTLSGK